MTSSDSGRTSLVMMAEFHGIPVQDSQVRHEFGEQPFNTQNILLAALHFGMKAKSVIQASERLDKAPLPAIGKDGDGKYFVLAQFKVTQAGSSPGLDGRVLIQRPGEPPAVFGYQEFLALWSGELILFTSKATYASAMAQFDFSWFIPAIVKYRKLLSEVLLISLVLQLIGLVTPMFFQVVMDKVLVNHALKTLKEGLHNHRNSG